MQWKMRYKNLYKIDKCQIVIMYYSNFCHLHLHLFGMITGIVTDKKYFNKMYLQIMKLTSSFQCLLAKSSYHPPEKESQYRNV